MFRDDPTTQPPFRPEVAPPPELPAGQTPTAYRLAALVLGLGVLMGVVGYALSGNANPLAIVIDLVLVIGLLLIKAWARGFALFRAVVGALLYPFLAFQGGDMLSGAISLAIQWGYCGALILLLTGTTRPWRLAAALAVFAIFSLAPFALLLFFSLLSLPGG